MGFVVDRRGDFGYETGCTILEEEKKSSIVTGTHHRLSVVCGHGARRRSFWLEEPLYVYVDTQSDP